MAIDQQDGKRIEAFKRRVTDFANTYGEEFALGCDVAFHTDDADDLSASITLNIYGRSTCVVPVTTDERGNAAIEFGDDSHLSLNGVGLYTYLFIEADRERRHLAEQVERLEARPPTTVTANGAILASDTAGMACPRCGAQGPFNITVTGQVSVENTDNGPVGFGDMEFDGGSDCVCEECGYEGFIREFRPGTPGTYTVVLLYPDDAGDNDLHTYVQRVQAPTPQEAEAKVRTEASKANNADIPAENFRMVAVFAGDCPLELNGGNI